MASLESFHIRKEKKEIAELIYKHYETEGLPRPYIGMSGLGGCTRALWFSFRQVKKGITAGRTNLIFQTGHDAELQVITHLQAIGMKVENALDNQAEFSCAYGYCLGHGDGEVSNVPGAERTLHLLEIKTANDASFKATVKGGVKEAKFGYYCQMMLYMYHAKLTRALFVMYNKNTSAYYTERLNADNEFAKELVKKAESIVFSENFNDFPRIGSNSRSWYECKWCNYIDICFGSEKTKEKNCRTCNNCNLLGDGKFGCGKYNDRVLNLDEQKEGCKSHTFLESLK